MDQRIIKIIGPDHRIMIEKTRGRIIVKFEGHLLADTLNALTLREAKYALPLQRDGIAIGGELLRAIRRTLLAQRIKTLMHQKLRPFGSRPCNDRCQGIQPFARLYRIFIRGTAYAGMKDAGCGMPRIAVAWAQTGLGRYRAAEFF